MFLCISLPFSMSYSIIAGLYCWDIDFAKLTVFALQPLSLIIHSRASSSPRSVREISDDSLGMDALKAIDVGFEVL
ncbi:hypothetical protein BD408DRAFT_408194 [Parasitella parasitica]|nr:hypothetical protein BD408DRAFT_408194 [Parasitella parasitica]